MTTDITRRGSIPSAMAWMIGLSILLSWIPLFGGLIAGYVGGSKAGSVGRAVAAVFLPGLILWVTMMFLGPLLAMLAYQRLEIWSVPLSVWMVAPALAGSAAGYLAALAIAPWRRALIGESVFDRRTRRRAASSCR